MSFARSLCNFGYSFPSYAVFMTSVLFTGSAAAFATTFAVFTQLPLSVVVFATSTFCSFHTNLARKGEKNGLRLGHTFLRNFPLASSVISLTGEGKAALVLPLTPPLKSELWQTPNKSIGVCVP